MKQAIFPSRQYHCPPILISTLMECWALPYAGGELLNVKTAKNFLLL
jgi:hypothetical protein